eukprot:7156712-Prymnesium_polylepis.1
MTYSTADNSRPLQSDNNPGLTVVRLGVLLPMFTGKASQTSKVTWSPRVGVYQAIREINDKTDGVEDALLPGTRLLFAYADSKCESGDALQAALRLTQNAFGTNGVDAIIGAGCSSASLMASNVASGAQVPMISPSSHAPELSDNAHHYFLRTIPSDEWLAHGMVDVLQHRFGYQRVALISSSDAYSAGAARAFGSQAISKGLSISASVTFLQESTDFAQQNHQLLRSNVRVLILFAQGIDGARFMNQSLLSG